jgi:hypothetical protein
LDGSSRVYLNIVSTDEKYRWGAHCRGGNFIGGGDPTDGGNLVRELNLAKKTFVPIVGEKLQEYPIDAIAVVSIFALPIIYLKFTNVKDYCHGVGTHIGRSG